MLRILSVAGGGATATATPEQLSHQHGINTGKEYQGSATAYQPKNACEGIHAAHGGAGGPCDHHDVPHQVSFSAAFVYPMSCTAGTHLLFQDCLLLRSHGIGRSSQVSCPNVDASMQCRACAGESLPPLMHRRLMND